jgi:hypothetical protein
MSPVSDMETGHDAARINLTFPPVEPKAGTALVVILLIRNHYRRFPHLNHVTLYGLTLRFRPSPKFVSNRYSIWRNLGDCHPMLRRLEDQIRSLCCKALTAKDNEMDAIFRDLRSALHDHTDRLRQLAAAKLFSAKDGLLRRGVPAPCIAKEEKRS